MTGAAGRPECICLYGAELQFGEIAKVQQLKTLRDNWIPSDYGESTSGEQQCTAGKRGAHGLEFPPRQHICHRKVRQRAASLIKLRLIEAQPGTQAVCHLPKDRERVRKKT